MDKTSIVIDFTKGFPYHFTLLLIRFGGKMYAIIETGGKQYLVKKGDIIDVDLLEGEKEITRCALKNAKLGIYLDISSFETPSS